MTTSQTQSRINSLLPQAERERRDAFIVRYHGEGMATKDIAVIVGCSEGVVKKVLKREKQKGGK